MATYPFHCIWALQKSEIKFRWIVYFFLFQIFYPQNNINFCTGGLNINLIIGFNKALVCGRPKSCIPPNLVSDVHAAPNARWKIDSHCAPKLFDTFLFGVHFNSLLFEKIEKTKRKNPNKVKARKHSLMSSLEDTCRLAKC